MFPRKSFTTSIKTCQANASFSFNVFTKFVFFKSLQTCTPSFSVLSFSLVKLGNTLQIYLKTYYLIFVKSFDELLDQSGFDGQMGENNFISSTKGSANMFEALHEPYFIEAATLSIVVYSIDLYCLTCKHGLDI